MIYCFLTAAMAQSPVTVPVGEAIIVSFPIENSIDGVILRRQTKPLTVTLTDRWAPATVIVVFGTVDDQKITAMTASGLSWTGRVTACGDFGPYYVAWEGDTEEVAQATRFGARYCSDYRSAAQFIVAQ